MGFFDKALGALGVGADIFGASASAKAIKEANASNERIARENRQFQERMSSTAFQRAYTDMKAAGINPILAAGSQASSPGGSTATMQNAGAPFEGLGSKAMANMYSAAQLKVAENSAEKIKADTRLTNVQADKLSDVTEPLGDAADAYRSVRKGVTNTKFRTMIQDAIDFVKGNQRSRLNAVGDVFNSAKGIKDAAGKLISDYDAKKRQDQLNHIKRLNKTNPDAAWKAWEKYQRMYR